MSGTGVETGESDWTKANLQKLLAALKTSLPEHDRMSAYTQGLKTVDWNKVAFQPFSPEECQEKWIEILQKMRKIRSLTELIIEAEDVISNPAQNNETERCLAAEEYKGRMLEFRKQYHTPPRQERSTNPKRKRVSADTPDGEQRTEDEGLPPKPPFNGYNLFCKDQVTSMAGVSKTAYVSVWAQRWRDLTERQRDEYSTRCRELKRQYSIKLNEYLMTFDEEEQQRILDKHGIKRPKVLKDRKVKLVKKFPGEPKMPPRSGNAYFCKEQMELLKKKFSNSKERFIKVSKLWQDLTNKEKEDYKGKVHESVTKYSVELQKWFKTLTPAEQKDYQTCNPSKCKKYLDAEQMKVHDREEPCVYIPSDSEDEVIEDSSSDEEENVLDCEEDEEEEEKERDDIMFEMF